MNYFTYFIEENKSGYKSRENWLKKNNNDLYLKIINHCSGDLEKLSFKEKIWYFINDKKEIVKCECGKNLKFKNSLSSGYGKYCSLSCSNSSESRVESIKKTNLDRYGVSSTLMNESTREKIKETNLKKFGVKNIFENVDYIKNKTIEKFGVDHIAKLDSTKYNRVKTNIERYGNETPLSNPSIREKGLIKRREEFLSKYESLNIQSTKDNDIIIKCHECKNDYIIDRNVLYHRFKITDNPCTLCTPKNDGVSIQEKELREFITSLNIDFEVNDRKIINGKELDIFIPSNNICIEYNGLYWHSEKYVNKDYHLNKTILCNDSGIQLIHIFEDEWLYKKDIVKSRLRNILGMIDNKIFARKCEIREVNTKEKTKFLNDNHIQGAVGSKINLGLYYNNELVSIMTFGSFRKVLGLKNIENKYELIRFCNKINANVIGGASKLLKYFIGTYQPKEIISYADRRWSTGNLYDKLGFSYDHNSNPNYFYIINNSREHRFKYRKDMLIREGFDKNKTEHEIMLERGIYRIYDCGTITYKKTLY
jgi:hypothetical protein